MNKYDVSATTFGEVSINEANARDSTGKSLPPPGLGDPPFGLRDHPTPPPLLLPEDNHPPVLSTDDFRETVADLHELERQAHAFVYRQGGKFFLVCSMNNSEAIFSSILWYR